LPVGILAFIVLYLSLPRKIHQAKNKRIDYLGSALLTACLVPLILFFSVIASTNTITPKAIVLLVVSFIAFLLFYNEEKRASSPIFSHHLFHDRHFVIPGIMTFIGGIIIFAATLYIQIYAQKVMGLSIQSSGILLSAIMIPLTLSGPIYGQIISKTGRYKKVVVFSSAVLFLSVVAFTIMLLDHPTATMVRVLLVPLGIGMGGMMSVFNMILQMVYPRERMGEVTGALQLVRGIGGTFGTALLGFVFGYYVKDINTDVAQISHALVTIFSILSVFCLIALSASFFMKEKKVTI
jgi:hypothetical protein